MRGPSTGRTAEARARRPPTASSGAVPGATTPGTSAPRTGTAAIRATGTATSAFAVPSSAVQGRQAGAEGGASGESSGAGGGAPRRRRDGERNPAARRGGPGSGRGQARCARLGPRRLRPGAVDVSPPRTPPLGRRHRPRPLRPLGRPADRRDGQAAPPLDPAGPVPDGLTRG